MKKYPKYKDSGIEWMKYKPENWDIKRIKYVVSINDEVLTENTDDEFEFDYVEIGNVNHTKGIEGYKRLTFKDAPSRARRIVKNGDIIVSTVRTYLKAIAKINSDKENIIVSTGFAVLRPHAIDSNYLGFIMLTEGVIGEIISKSVGVSYPAITANELSNIKIPLPKSDEQTAIANFLDQKTTQIDQTIAKKERLIELLEEERKAIINQAVTKGISSFAEASTDKNPDVKLKPSGIEWLGDIPEHWDTVRIKRIAKIKYGLGQPPKQLDSGLPLIRATNIERGKINTKDLIFVDPEDIPYERDPVLKENDIIVVRSGAYTADSAIIPKEFEGAITGYDMVLTPHGCNPKLLAYALLSNYLLINQLFLHRLRAAQPHLNAEELGESFILLPTKDEQIGIINHIEKESQRIHKVTVQIRREIELLKEYRQALIFEAVTGKIDVRN
jgi:type I restriction enzyme S subunit